MASAYSHTRRTALVLSGTGAHGAYHAGVLRAFREGGVKIDLVAGHGVGAAGAALAAIDGGARLWESNGVWSGSRVGGYYRWTRVLRSAGWMVAVLTAVLLVPLALLCVALLVYALGFALEIAGSDAGRALMAALASWLQGVLTGHYLLTMLPRLVMGLAAAVLLVLVGAAALGRRQHGPTRRRRGRWWRPLDGSPLEGAAIRAAFSDTVWQLVRGGSPAKPDERMLGRRYAEALAESLGQPGFLELVIVATDVDARQDLTAALLREPYRERFMAPQAGRERGAEALDLAGTGRDHAVDVVLGALTPSLEVDPHPIAFAPDSYWRGETHRLCDRPGSIDRLLEELRVAGVEQVVVVTAVPAPVPPHRLTPPAADLHHRLGDSVMAGEAASLQAALQRAAAAFEAVYVIAPTHNPLGPFDFGGAYDPSSDRLHTLGELMDGGYEDASRQFIEPIVGASGDHLHIGDVYGQRLLHETDP